MDVKKEHYDDPHAVIKTESDFISNQTEVTNSQQTKNTDSLLDIADSQTKNIKIKGEIVKCEIVSVCDNIKKEFGNTSEVKVDIKHFKDESELLNTHCDLPTLKNECVDNLDYLQQSYDGNTLEDVSKKEQYPCLVCHKDSSDTSNSSNENTPMDEESTVVKNNKLTKALIDNTDEISSSKKVYSYLRTMEYSNTEKIDKYDLSDDDSFQLYLSPSESKCIASNSSHSSEILINDEDNFNEIRNTANTVKRKTNNNVFCMFCFEKVSHFPRHLIRKHQEEESVRKIMALPVKGSERKNAISALRKKGSFILMEQKNHLKPVRLPNAKRKINENIESDKVNTDNYFPCVYCLGFYSKTYLWKHKKNCNSRINDTKKSRYHLAESQTFLVSTGMLGNFLNQTRLKKEIFNVMKPDKISAVVKKDALICLFGDAQLNKHKKGNMNISVSNKMRELARLKIALQNIIKFVHLIDVLNPENYREIIKSVKIICGYEPDLKKFKAPSLAVHLGPSLQILCRVAIKAITIKNPIFGKKDDNEIVKQCKEIEDLCDKIKLNWYEDVASLANKVINDNKNEKYTLIELITDVKLFNNYTTSLARGSIEKLKNNDDIINNYRILVECAIAMVLIFNKNRVGEVQFLDIENYEQDSYSYQSHREECLNSLTNLEKAMITNYKTTIVFGKESKAVPILFTKQMQELIDELLKIRQTKNIVPDTNKYVFANNNDRWVNGFTALRKLANKCGAKHPKLLTSVTFRNQVATILQIVNFDKNQLGKMAKFMGHTEETFLEFYSLPEDLHQTAKVAKVLLLINAGKGETFKGKKLKDIELNENESFDDVELKDPDIEADIERESTDDVPSSSIEVTEQESIGPVKKSRRYYWTKDQKSTALHYFKDHIKKKKLPKKDDCLKFINQHLDLFENISWSRVKILVYNTYRVKP